MKKITALLFVLLILVLTGCGKQSFSPEDSRPFDFYTDCTAKEDIEDLKNEPFVKGVFPFTLMIFRRPGYSNQMEGQIAYLAAPSFDNLEITPFGHGSLKALDSSIMNDPGRNPVLIDDAAAKAEKLSVGDTFYQETKISDEPLSFTVAGIFRHRELFAQFEAVLLINGQIEQLFSERVDEMGYTNAYVKASDLTALTAYFEEDFIPHLQFKGLSEEEIAAIPREDLKAYYEDYETHMNRMR